MRPPRARAATRHAMLSVLSAPALNSQISQLPRSRLPRTNSAAVTTSVVCSNNVSRQREKKCADTADQIGRASGRERVCKYVMITVVVLLLKTKTVQNIHQQKHD